MADPGQAGFGGFGDVATHSVDLLRWILDDRSAVHRCDHLGDGAHPDEYGEALLVFDDGTLGTVAGSWVDRSQPVVIELSGSEGHAMFAHGRLRYASDHVPGADGREPWRELPHPGPHPFDSYLDALLGRPDVELTSVWQAADRVAVMEAIYRSVETRAWVTPERVAPR
jgi:predicted dehydrogenase